MWQRLHFLMKIGTWTGAKDVAVTGAARDDIAVRYRMNKISNWSPFLVR